MAYRLVAFWRSVADAPGKLAAGNIEFADSLAISPKVIVGTSVWFWSHTSACTIDPPNVTLCRPLSQVAVSSMTFVDASRDDWPLPRPGFVRTNPVPQQVPAVVPPMAKRKPA